MCTSSVKPMAISSEGTAAVMAFSGMPMRAMMPTVHTMLTTPVMSGMSMPSSVRKARNSTSRRTAMDSGMSVSWSRSM